MIPKSILKLIAGLQEYRYLKNRLMKVLAYGFDFIISHTISEAYVRSILKHIDLGLIATVSFDCDLHEDIKAYDKLLDILDEHNIKASFAVIGKLIELYPEEHKVLVENGHEIVNHTYTHPHSMFNNRKITELSYKELRREIKLFDEVCLKTLDYKPIGFRAPHFINVPIIYNILEELNYFYSSSTIATRTRSLGRPYVVNNIVEIPLTPCPKHPFATFATWGLYRAPKRWYNSEDEFFKLFTKVVKIGKGYNAYLNFYFDPTDVVRMNKFDELLYFIQEHYKILPYHEIIRKVMGR